MILRLMRPHLLHVVSAGLGLALLASCSSDSDTPAGSGGPAVPSTTLIGVMMNGAENGALTVTIATTTLAPPAGATILGTSVVAASASFRPVGASAVGLSGTYDTDTDTLSLSGGGYAFSALIETTPVTFNAQYTGPNGPGFVGAIEPSGSTQTALSCGTYMSGSTSESGNISFFVSDTTFAGVSFSSTSGTPIPFEGSISGTGTTRTISAQGGDTGVLELTIDGMVNTLTGQSSGTWQIQDFVMPSEDDDGTWSAGPCP